MRRPGVICEVFDIVVVPFPFADRDAQRRRPALVLTPYQGFGIVSDVVTLAMITAARSSSWPGDVPLSDLVSAGLNHECLVRMKFATLSYSRVEKQIGQLGGVDAAAIGNALASLFSRAMPIDAAPQHS